MRSLSSSSLVESKVLANMFSRKMECGTPIGRRFFIARITQRSLNTWLPWMSMLPTLTLGPSVTLNVTSSEEGGIWRISGVTVANWRPRSARNSLSTTEARWILLGSYCDSTESPTLRSLNRSRISETVTDFAPSYLIERTTRRSVRTKRMMTPVAPCSASRRMSSKRPVFHSAMKSRRSISSLKMSPFLEANCARSVS